MVSDYVKKGVAFFVTKNSFVLPLGAQVAATLYAGGIILDYLLGWNVFFSAFAMILVTAVYTAVGGLKTVVYTECFQTVTLLIGGLVVCGVSMHRVGGA
jgi:SSS family solute:Na+ symporter